MVEMVKGAGATSVVVETAGVQGSLGARPPVLSVDRLQVSYRQRGGLHRARPVRAVDGVSLDILPGETVGLVGESGSGKSSFARAVMRLVQPESGTISLMGTDITRMSHRTMRPYRRHLQMVFQDPYSSLDPSMVVGDSVAEPLAVHERLRGKERDARVQALFDSVGLGAHHLQRYPHEFSGGQRQRLAIARALSVQPDLIVLDEALSALDVSTQHQIVDLLEKLQAERNVAYLFIAHDLAVVRRISHRVAVMYLGNLVEIRTRDELFDSPMHPYTHSLLSAIPIPDPDLQRQRQRIVLQGEVPDPSNAPKGCPFSTRCPRAWDLCREVKPALTPAPGGAVACHLYTTEGKNAA